MEPKLRVDLSTIGSLPFFSRAQAREWGISDKDLRILVRRGLLIRLDRGIYTDRVAGTAEELHVLRSAAALQLHGDTVAAARCSAALLHGLPLVRAELGTVELVQLVGTHGRKRPGVRETVGRAPVVEVPVLDIGITARVVDVAHAIAGTAASNNLVAALAAGDHALRLGLCTRQEVEAAVRSMSGQAGVAGARRMLEHLDPRHESPGETLTAWVLRALGWRFEPQHEVVVDGRTYRLDFILCGQPVAIEFDGEMKYDGDDEEEVRAAQEARQQALEDAGWSFARLDWGSLADPGEVNRRVLEALRQATAA